MHTLCAEGLERHDGAKLKKCQTSVCLSCGMPSGMFLIFKLRLFLPVLSCSRRGVLLLAAALRQHVLPPGSPASLHEPADDERLFKSEGKYFQLSRRFLRVSLFFPSVAPNATASLSLPLRSSWAPTPRVGRKCSPFSREQVFSATTGKKTWRPTSNPPSPSPSTRLVKEASGAA